MGYETQLLVVNHYQHTGDRVHYETFPAGSSKYAGKRYLQRPSGEVIATVDLSKAGYETHTGLVLENARSEARDTGFELFFPASKKGRTEYVDLYGNSVSSVNRTELILAMQRDNASDPYRRFALALTILREFDKLSWDGDSIKVFQYGY